MSSRLDESVIHLISKLAKNLNKTKKEILEGAIRLYSSQLDPESKSDDFLETFGAWKRKESFRDTVKQAHQKFNQSMNRYYL